MTAKNGLFTTLTYIFIHGCWLHFTGSMISSRAKFFSMRESDGRLRFVPLAVVFRSRMDVVSRGIVVLDLDGLTGHYTQNVGMVLAALLVEVHRILGHVECSAAQSVFHIDEDIGKLPPVTTTFLGFVGAFAARDPGSCRSSRLWVQCRRTLRCH